MKENKFEQNKSSLLELLAPKANSTIMIYDLHASESGALAILDDLYNQIRDYEDKSVKWIMVISTPIYAETENIIVKRFPWTKKNWGYRLFFDFVYSSKLLRLYKPEKVFSLQNKGLDNYSGTQMVYLHLPFVLTEHRFEIKKDGSKLWLYQNVVSKSIFKSLKKVNMIVVQTQWMKDALVNKAGVARDKITVIQPDIRSNKILSCTDNQESRRTFFYPATAFTYKNHMTLLKAINYAKEQGLDDYEVILTIRSDENKLTNKLYKYANENGLNIQFNGPISRQQVFETYSRSTLLFPSLVESFGLPLLEAKLSGCYIITSNCAFSREILDDYDKGIFFEEMDFVDMGKKILELVNI